MIPNNDDIASEIGGCLDELFGDDNDNEFDIVKPTSKIDSKALKSSKPNEAECSEKKIKPAPCLKDSFISDLKPRVQIKDSPLRHLNAVVLSIDWEINDQIMEKFNIEINKLKNLPLVKKDKFLLKLFDLLTSVGKYIKVKGSEAHPDSIKLLQSLYSSLEQAMAEDVTKTDKQGMLENEFDNFKKFKQKIAIKKSSASVKIKEELYPSDQSDMQPYKAFVSYALDEIKKTIREEFSTLRKEIKLLKKEVK
ncbi:conserved hypothetical protein [Candidatus Magnetomoraceae bacterium gMMP-1]